MATTTIRVDTETHRQLQEISTSAGEVWTIDFGEPYPGEPAHHRPA